VSSTGARAAWWTIVVVLILGIAAATTIGVRQSDRSPVARPDPAAARHVVTDTIEFAVPKLLSYTPENVEASLKSARSLLTGTFKESYGDIIDRTIIPAAKSQRITTAAKVVGTAVESLTDDAAKVLVFVNQETTKAADIAPTKTANSVRAGLQKVNGAWLIDGFDPL
jgi:Mce-associated membrane protein